MSCCGCALGFEARGLIFGAPLALALGCAFVPLRKPGKLPGELLVAAWLHRAVRAGQQQPCIIHPAAGAVSPASSVSQRSACTHASCSHLMCSVVYPRSADGNRPWFARTANRQHLRHSMHANLSARTRPYWCSLLCPYLKCSRHLCMAAIGASYAVLNGICFACQVCICGH